MSDIFTKEKRSEVMSKIRGKDTKIELLVFRELRKKKIYFQKHYRMSRISIDIALPRKKKAVFIDGDFWHGYDFEKRKDKLPEGYWVEKIRTNISRDERIRNSLISDGWQVLRIWEHEIKNDISGAVEKILLFLRG